MTRMLASLPRIGRWYSALVWEPRDLWVGVYWTREEGKLLLYICFIPTVVWKIVRWGHR
jgi:hypothetical protein